MCVIIKGLRRIGQALCAGSCFQWLYGIAVTLHCEKACSVCHVRLYLVDCVLSALSGVKMLGAQKEYLDKILKGHRESAKTMRILSINSGPKEQV